MSPPAVTDVLDRVLDPIMECLTPEVAFRLANLRADTRTQARLDELADMANERQLAPQERAEYDRYLEAFHFVTVLQLKARTFLEKKAAS
jgi:hypothetical protein